jgi:nicotinamide riboside kinase
VKQSSLVAPDVTSGVASILPPKLGLVGGECSGKTTLGQALAADLDGVHVPEALRDFVELHGRAPAQAEQAAVMSQQESAELLALQAAVRDGKGAVICDPAALMTAIYSVAYYDDYSLLPAGLAHAQSYDMLIWCDTAFPWQPDGAQRDGPEHRDRVDAIIGDVLASSELAVIRAAGLVPQRVATVLSALRRESSL